MDIQVTFITVNRRGQPQRDQQRLAGPTVTIGRGTQCQIHLPDPRIALEHAQITVSESGATITAPEAGRLQVNGRSTDGTRLAVGDSVEIGPYLLEVEAPPPGVPLAVSIKLVVPLTSFGGDGRRFQLRAPRLSKRRLSYIAFIGTLLLCLIIPVAPSLLGYPTMVSVHRATQADKEQYYLNTGTTLTEKQYYVSKLAEDFFQSWNPGPVSAAHQVIGSDCRACHQFPFVQVRDLSCVSCHKRLAEHVVPVKSAAGEGAPTSDQVYGRCATCHRDHKGTQMAPHGQEECTACHGSEEKMKGIVATVTNFKCDAPDGKPAKVMDFDGCHPEFRLAVQDPPSQRDPGKKGEYAVRWVDLGSKDMVERSNLKFDHRLHLDKEGVRDRVGKLRDPDPAKDKQAGKDPGGRRVLHCADCHQPAEGGRAEAGRLIAPVTFEQHCQSCHSLQFEPGRPQREVAHKPPAELLDDLLEFYARRVLGSVPGDVKAPEGLRVRPGAATVSSPERRQALKEAEAKAKLAFNELFTEGPVKTRARDVCVTCHKLSRTSGDPGWEVAPVHVTKEWMPRGRFTHAKHLNMRGGRTPDENCLECHKGVQDSKTSDTIAMPDIKICRDCHVSAKPAEHIEGKIASDCAMCHRFHFGQQLWFGELQSPQRKKKAKE